jgi:bifunctional non-homologous end joining protein LigD
MPARKKPSEAFTVPFPKPLPAERRGEHWWVELDGRELRLSNLDKVFWPEEGYTKGDLLAYYYNASELILPYLAERPLTMKRMPNGITGDFFYEKSAPSHTPEWIPRCPVLSGDAKTGVIDYLMVQDLSALLFVVNLGCIEFHPLHSRCRSIEHPDYLFFDLDPFEPITYDDVLAVARHVKVVLDRVGLRGYPKTSGATGMQIYVPIEPQWSYEVVREFVGRAGQLIRTADPDRVTMAWQIKDRSGHVFIDHNMNREGANIAAAYSVRPEPRATVSTPVTWEEVEAGVTPQDFRIDNVWERWASVGDLFRPVLAEPQDISAALDALGVDPAEIDRAANDETVPKRGRFSKKAASEPAPPPTPAASIEGGSTSRARTRSEEVIARSRDPNLAEYVKKRDFEGTPEPAPRDVPATGNSFVIQKHRATRLHYDLRLEKDGALPSWAVPRGLPTQRGDRRLAVQTEDHPLEYGSFEGEIPKGHYGAGSVRIFDNGTYELVERTDKKVSFKLHGHRYRGQEYHLVKTRTDWLIFLASAQDVPLIESPPTFSPMLAEGGHEPFDDPSWRFEPKLDGVRSLVYTDTESTRLVSRSGRDQTATYPELGTLHEIVHSVNCVLDGEIVATDEEGRASFEALQSRINLHSAAEIKRAREQVPVVLVAFDILWFEGEDLTGLPLEERRKRMEAAVEKDPARLDLAYYVDGRGLEFTEAARKLELEGVMAKKLGSKYLQGRRTSDWRKIKLLNRQDCVILGWTPGQKGRAGSFGALLVGAYVDGELRWIGQVGTGFTDRMLSDVLELLKPLVRDTPPIADPELAKVKGATWVEPQVVCEVEFLQMTKVGKLRAPSFKGLRPDKGPADAVWEEPATAAVEA